MNRIDRLAAILIQFQSRRLVKAQDLADKFSISLRTVYRDVKALEEAGVPIIGEAGTGYKLMEGYKLPPVMFTQEEATALLTASKLVQSATDTGITKHYLAALDKIRAILRYSEKEHIEDIDEHIAVLKHSAIVYEPEKELHLQPILKAIGSSLVAEIIYTTLEKSETSTRKIEPVGIYYMGSHWYLVAWCRLRNDYRNFRTDQVKQLRITEETYSKTHPSLQSFLNKMSDEKELIKVVLDVDASIVKRLGQQKYYSGFVKEEHLGNHVRMTFLTSSLMGFSRWLMLFADHAEIIQPVQLKEMVTGIAENILKKTQPLLT
ncbi:MAG TPA: YafY family protein [Chitinophagaceae bacterium]|nr:YafY family transcriptional regulator [Chitinophagaceae bacterium]MCB9055029.1 YafY family transcriptional regulator [Chitinophagales bacterium]HPG10701.1 YafY family protein [Chitinophagaceae bacterium]